VYCQLVRSDALSFAVEALQEEIKGGGAKKKGHKSDVHLPQPQKKGAAYYNFF
jgi:hypothetical protein